MGTKKTAAYEAYSEATLSSPCLSPLGCSFRTSHLWSTSVSYGLHFHSHRAVLLQALHQGSGSILEEATALNGAKKEAGFVWCNYHLIGALALAPRFKFKFEPRAYCSSLRHEGHQEGAPRNHAFSLKSKDSKALVVCVCVIWKKSLGH